MSPKTPSRKDASLNAARAAKAKASELFADLAVVNGIGITRDRGEYAVKVNCESLKVPNARLPQTIDDVPVIVKVVGSVNKQ
ncbi:MAG TPA: hypothetical protein ENI80_04740 [Acidiferrobacteraceae bacterium]|nr:hypothetical protein [Acidiferrobacteraceae bacterium]